VISGGEIVNAVSLGVMPLEWKIGGAGDFDSDGKEDILWERISDGLRAAWLLNGAGGVKAAVSFGVVPTEWRMAGAGDYDSDGKDDILWENVLTGLRAVWLMDGGAGVRASVSLGTLLEWHMIAANDMTGDAKDDILLEHTTDGRRVLWGMNGGQVGMAVLLGTMGLEWQIAGTGDIEGNGKDDILWQRIDNGLRAAWLMNGTGGVISAPALTVESPSWDIAAVLIPDKTPPPPPETNVALTSLATTNRGYAIWTFTSNAAGAAFECSLNTGAFAACTSPHTRNDLVSGSNTFRVRAKSAAGVVDPTPASSNVTVTAAAVLHYAFSGNVVNGGSLAGVPAGALTNGAFVLGKVGQAIKLDGTASAKAVLTGSKDVLVKDYEWTIGVWFREDSPLQTSVGLVDFRGSDAGWHTYHGVTSSLVTTCSDAGCASFATPAAGGWHHLLYRYDGVSLTAGGAIQIFLNGVEVAVIPNASALPLIRAGIVDLVLGNFAGTTNASRFYVDELKAFNRVFTTAEQCTIVIGGTWTGTACTLPPPTTTIELMSLPTTNRNSATWTFSSNEGNATFECSLNSAAFAACTSPHTRTDLVANLNSLRVRAKNPAGTVDPSPPTSNVTWSGSPLLHYRFSSNLVNSGALAGIPAGTSTNAAFVMGKVGQAIKFDGSAGTKAVLGGTRDVLTKDYKWTIGFWYKVDAHQDDARLIDFRGEQHGWHSYDALATGSNIYTCSGPATDAACTNFTQGPAGVWRHLLYRYDASSASGLATIDIYLDGVYRASVPAPASVPRIGPTLTDIVLGLGSAYYIDELRVYNRVFSVGEQCTVIIGGTWTGSSCTLPPTFATLDFETLPNGAAVSEGPVSTQFQSAGVTFSFAPNAAGGSTVPALCNAGGMNPVGSPLDRAIMNPGTSGACGGGGYTGVIRLHFVPNANQVEFEVRGNDAVTFTVGALNGSGASIPMSQIARTVVQTFTGPGGYAIRVERWTVTNTTISRVDLNTANGLAILDDLVIRSP
jgi:hypothetical protein